jgi:hypothetical protein
MMPGDVKAAREVKLRVLSLGAGVQSTTLALMAKHGEAPMPDVAIFADTQWEPEAVYKHLRWLMSVLPYEVITVSAGDIRQAIRDRRNTTGGRFAAIPWHTVNPDGSHGMGRRQCSSEYKLGPIMHAIRAHLGKPGRVRIPSKTVEVLLGISRDEAQRMRESRQRYMVNRYPLIEMGMTRQACLRWLDAHGYPRPAKSACIGCPYHDNDHWRGMRDNQPEEWADAVAADHALRIGDARGMRAIEFMHPQRVPLDEVDLSVDNRQLDLFGNECEGVCGV